MTRALAADGMVFSIRVPTLAAFTAAAASAALPSAVVAAWRGTRRPLLDALQCG